jgi:phage terminase large subunit-like protein
MTTSSSVRVSKLEGLEAYVRDGVIYSACGRFYFDEETATRWEKWFSRFLTHDDGTPLELMPAWRDLTRQVFGWLNIKTGLRKVREVLIYLPRGNAKTTVTAGLALGLITIDGAVAAEVYLQASDASEAAYMMKCARGFIERSPKLQPLYTFEKDEDDHLFIQHTGSGSKLMFYSGKPKAIGKRPHAAFIDEVQKQKNEEIIQSYRTGFMKRVGTRATNALLFLFGTAPEEEEEGSETPLHKVLEKARKALANPDQYPQFFALMRETTEDDDCHDPALWEHVNIGWGISVDPEQFLTLYEDSKGDPEKWVAFCRYNLNKKMQSASAYMPLNRWDECYQDFSLKDLRGREYFGGLDFSHNDDMTAFGFIFPWWEQVTAPMLIDGQMRDVEIMIPKQQVLAYYFAPQSAINASANAAVKYQPWVDEGWLEVCGKEAIDFGYIRSRYMQIIKFLGKPPTETGYDPFHANETITLMANGDENYAPLEMVPISQHKRQLHAPTQKIKTMTKEGTIFHNGNPILRWNWKNARLVSDDKGNTMLSKRLSKGVVAKIAKIDGGAALINANRCWMDKEPPKPSVYEKRGLMSI